MKLVLVVIVVFYASLFNLIAFSGNGLGTESDPYQITNVEQLQEMSDELDAHYILMNDIDASDTKDWNDGKGFDPIGEYDEDIDSLGFMGSIIGGGFSIDGLFIYRADEDNVGLFSCVSHGANIWDISINEADITGNKDVAIFVGSIRPKYQSVIIEKCAVHGSLTGKLNTGGICGNIEPGIETELIDCVSKCEIIGRENVGGLIGHIFTNGIYLKINNCFSECNITAEDPGNNIGGFIGLNHINFGGRLGLRNCASFGSVAGISNVGGFFGQSQATLIFGFVRNCYTMCDVEGETNVGGFCGKFTESIFENCYSTGSVFCSGVSGGFCGNYYEDMKYGIKYSYYDSETSGFDSSDGGIAKTTAQMKTKSTFETWDFDKIWDIDPEINTGYPFLRSLVTVSVDEAVKKEKSVITIFPNPAQDRITISLSDSDSEMISSVKISDLSGRLLLTAKTNQIDVSALSKGIYIVTVSINEELNSAKLIIR